MFDSAINYFESGLCVLPANSTEKRPTLSRWKQYQQRLPTEQHLQTWFADAKAMCILAGAVSGNLEVLDFDHEGELFDPWRALVASEVPGLAERLVVERTQSGGLHVVYRCEEPIPGNHKLAQRTLVVDSADPVEITGKRYLPRRIGDRFECTCTLIETRGEGGLFLCAPTPGYRMEQGSLDRLPTITNAERAVLIEAAYALNESIPPVAREFAQVNGEGRPGDDYNERGDVREVLQRHGWTLVKRGENEYWRRPGKQQGWSATLKEGVLYVFSSNASPFEPDRAYAPFTVYTFLEHDGDFGAAAISLRAAGYGQSSDDKTVDLSGLMSNEHAALVPTQIALPDPGPLPGSLLRVPGFISDVMDHCLATAPYPNVALAFCGALALQALLAGRKVRDQADNRTNIYLLALAYSSVGKDWPRKVNTKILHRVGLVSALGEKFASGEGIQDALFLTPTMLFQTDEIDGLLQSINKSRDALHENIMGTLLTLYSAANSVYPMRRKAGKESPGVIDQPCLIVYGMAIPNYYYEALSERMLTNGFFARMLIVESGPRSVGQEPGLIAPPKSVLETAHWWSEFNPGTGNLEEWHPNPQIVEADPEAMELLAESRCRSELEYANAESGGDPVGTTVWGRVPEQVRKLALLYAVSTNHLAPRIDAAAVRWATDFMLHQARRMLFMARNHVSQNPFDAECLRLLRKLREAPGQELSHSVLLKRMKIATKPFQELITTLEQQGDLETVLQTTSGRTLRSYRLVGERSSGGVKEVGSS